MLDFDPRQLQQAGGQHRRYAIDRLAAAMGRALF
jgi:hypothetical protein